MGAKVYTYISKDCHDDLDPAAGVYIVVCGSMGPRGSTHVIYVGETGNLRERFADHKKGDCFFEQGVECIIFIEEDDKESRKKLEDDLIERYTPPCNG